MSGGAIVLVLARQFRSACAEDLGYIVLIEQEERDRAGRESFEVPTCDETRLLEYRPAEVRIEYAL